MEIAALEDCVICGAVCCEVRPGRGHAAGCRCWGWAPLILSPLLEVVTGRRRPAGLLSARRASSPAEKLKKSVGLGSTHAAATRCFFIALRPGASYLTFQRLSCFLLICTGACPLSCGASGRCKCGGRCSAWRQEPPGSPVERAERSRCRAAEMPQGVPCGCPSE